MRLRRNVFCFFGERRDRSSDLRPIFRRPFHTTSTCYYHRHDLLRRPPHLRPPGRLVDDGPPLRFVRGRRWCRGRSGIAVRLRPADRRLHHRRRPRRLHGVRVAGREEGEDHMSFVRSLAYSLCLFGAVAYNICIFQQHISCSNPGGAVQRAIQKDIIELGTLICSGVLDTITFQELPPSLLSTQLNLILLN